MDSAINVALVVPLQGSAGIFGPSCELCAELAAAEVNAADGLLGRELRLSVIDGGAPPAVVADEVGALAAAGLVDAVVGWHISAVRQVVAPRVAGLVPYVYTALYEGGERTPGVFLTGEIPSRQLLPAMRWLSREHGVRRWAIVGNDYVWPRATARAARGYLDVCRGRLCHEEFVPLGCRDWDATLAAVRDARADAVLMLLVGADAVAFNRAFGASGLTCRRLEHADRREHAGRQRRREHARDLRCRGVLRDARHARVARLRLALHASASAPTPRRSTASASPATRASWRCPRSPAAPAASTCAG